VIVQRRHALYQQNELIPPNLTWFQVRLPSLGITKQNGRWLTVSHFICHPEREEDP
jgi:hypothetical protein